MAMGDWLVGVFLKFETNGLSTLGRLQASTAALNDRMRLSKGIIDKNAAAAAMYTRRLQAIRAEHLKMTAMYAGGAAIGIGAGIGYAVDQAAKLQTIMIAIQNATGATTSQLAKYSQTMYDIADANSMTVADVADIVRVFARSSGGRLSLAQLMDVTQHGGAQFAMIMKNARGEDYETSATQAITLAHMFRAYDPKGQAQMFDAMAHLGEMMPHNLNAAITQMGYFLPKLKTMGVDDSSAVALMAWMDQSGYGRGKGGTGLRSLVEQGLGPLQLTSHAQAGKAKLLREMGLIDAGGHSNFYNAKTQSFDIFEYLGHIHDWVKKQPRMDDALKTITGAFGTQGGNIAALMADPQIVAGLEALRKFATDARVSQKEQAGRYEGSFAFQFGRAASNFTSLVTEIGGYYLPWLTGAFKNLADGLHNFQAFLHKNKGAEAILGNALTLLGGIFGVVASAAVITNMLRFLGIIKELPNVIGWVVPSLRWLVSALWATAAGGPAASTGLWSTVTALRGVGAAALAAVAPMAIFAASIAAMVATLMLLATANTGMDFDAKNPAEIANALRQAKKMGWNGIDPHQRALLFGAGYKPGSFKGNAPVTLPGSRDPSGIFTPGRGGHPAAAKPQVQVNVKQVSFVLPKGTTTQQAQQIAMTLANLGGTSRTNATQPNPLTVGGAVFGFT